MSWQLVQGTSCLSAEGSRFRLQWVWSPDVEGEEACFQNSCFYTHLYSWTYEQHLHMRSLSERHQSKLFWGFGTQLNAKQCLENVPRRTILLHPPHPLHPLSRTSYLHALSNYIHISSLPLLSGSSIQHPCTNISSVPLLDMSKHLNTVCLALPLTHLTCASLWCSHSWCYSSWLLPKRGSTSSSLPPPACLVSSPPCCCLYTTLPPCSNRHLGHISLHSR